MHRRLSILDLSPAGWQPFADEAERRFVLLNGEIYNYVELRDELRSAGYAFRTSTDTEVVLAALDHWGTEALCRFQGMFALAYVDAERDELVLARDPFGIKPVFYVDEPGHFAFSSQMTTLMRLSERHSKANTRALFRYLRWGFPSFEDGTLVEGIRRLDPGTYLRIGMSDGAIRKRDSFWRLRPVQADLTRSEAAERLRALLLESVRMHLRSDVPVGIALSGGVDSSSLVALSRIVEPDADLNAFSFCAHDSSVDETPIIRRTAQRFGVRLHEVELEPGGFMGAARAASRQMDEVFGSTSILAEYLVFERARQEGVIVVLSGQGPDEMFAGYSRYRPLRAAVALREGRLWESIRAIRASSGWPDTPLPRTLAWCAHYLTPGFLAGIGRRVGRRDMVPSTLNASFFRERDAVQEITPAHAEGLSRFASYIFEDVFSVGLQGLLAWADQTGMIHSTEGRLPYLLTSLADFAFSLPYKYMVSEDGTCKSVLREAVRGIAPDEVLAVRRKIGFATDEPRYLEELRPVLKRMLDDGEFAGMPFVDLQKFALDLDSSKPLDRLYWRLANLRWWSAVNPVSFG